MQIKVNNSFVFIVGANAGMRNITTIKQTRHWIHVLSYFIILQCTYKIFNDIRVCIVHNKNVLHYARNRLFII